MDALDFPSEFISFFKKHNFQTNNNIQQSNSIGVNIMKLVKFGFVLLLPAIFVLSGCGKKAEAPVEDTTKVEAPAVDTTAATVDTAAAVDTTAKADTTAKK